MHYFLIAGEASGDLHAAHLIKAIKAADPSARFTFLGGDMMAEAAGTSPLIHYRDMAFMGFVDVLRHLGAVRRNFAAARAALRADTPDALILVDYPSFNLKMAAFAKKLGVRTYYFISPKVWAWKKWRVRTIKKVVDRMLCIFPFEVDFYQKYGYKVDYVGNPSVGEIDKALQDMPERPEVLRRAGIPDKPYIALLPGSRLGEIRENLPVMVEAIRRFPQYRAVVAGAPGVDTEFYEHFTRINDFNRLPVVTGMTYELLRHARAALVTSGTATLEAALIGTPQVAMYQGGGSKLLYNAMKKVLSIDYVTLPNLIADAPVIPELLMHLCTPQGAADAVAPLLTDTPSRAAMLEGYGSMRRVLGVSDAAARSAEIIVEDLHKH